MSSVKNKIINGTLILSIANFVMRFFSFLTIFIVVRALSVFEYGLFTLFMSLTGPVNSFSSMGMDELVLSDVSRSLGSGGYKRAKSILLHFFRIRFLILFCILLLALIFRHQVEIKYGTEVIQYFWLFVFLVLVQYLRNIYAIIFQIHEKFKNISLLNVLEVFIKFLFVVFFYYFWTLSVTTLIIAYVAGTAFSVLIFTPSIFKTIKYLLKVGHEKVDIVYQIFKHHGKWQTGLNLISGSTNTIKYWLIKVILSTEAVGILSLAQSLYSVVASVLPLKTVIFPIIAKKLNDRYLLQHILQKVTKYSLIIYGFVIIGSLSVVVPLIPYVFPKYIAAIPIFQLLSFKLLFNAFSITQSPVLFAYKDQKFLFMAGIVTLFSILILSPFLMLYFGLLGTIIESLITIFLIVFLRELYLRKKYGLQSIGLKSFFRIDDYDKYIIHYFFKKITNKLWLRS